MTPLDLRPINLRFQSNNSIPLDGARLTTDEWAAIYIELTARRAREEAVEAIAAADNTLHSAMDHWQERAIRAEAALRARDAEVGALVAAASTLKVCGDGRGYFESGDDCNRFRAALRPFHPSGSDAAIAPFAGGTT